MSLKKISLIIIGFIAFGLGCIGVVLPLLPTVPFMMLSGICFAKSSKKLDIWFKNTKLYKNNLQSYVKGEGMTISTKVKIISMVTILMAIGFIAMKTVVMGRIILFIVWIFHIAYFGLKIKTIEKQA